MSHASNASHPDGWLHSVLSRTGNPGYSYATDLVTDFAKTLETRVSSGSHSEVQQHLYKHIDALSERPIKFSGYAAELDELGVKTWNLAVRLSRDSSATTLLICLGT